MEPERKIEKWLRAFAKKRREQAGEPMQLRPAMRERLQREIARQSEEKSRGGFFSNFFFGPRLRLTFAACFAALVLGGWFLLHESAGPQPAQLSMNNISGSEIPPATAAPAAPETPPPPVMSPAVASTDKKALAQKTIDAPVAPQPTRPVVASANRSLAAPPSETFKEERDRTAGVPQQKQLIVTTTAAPAPTSNTTLAFRNEAAVDSIAAAGAIAKDAEGALPSVAVPQGSNLIAGAITPDTNPQTPPNALALQRAAAPGSTSASFDLSKATGAVTVSQLFNRREVPVTRRSAATALKTPAPVLNSFRVEQTGNNLKVFDADGSVYVGSVQIAQQEPAAEYALPAAKNAPSGKAQPAKTPAPAPQNYFFRVAGTNRNLNQNIVFSGNFVPLTNNQLTAGNRTIGGFGGGNFAGGLDAHSDQSAAQPVQAVLSNSEINGNVVIGSQKAINVIATPQH